MPAPSYRQTGIGDEVIEEYPTSGALIAVYRRRATRGRANDARTVGATPSPFGGTWQGFVVREDSTIPGRTACGR